jgi:hypothetical protein
MPKERSGLNLGDEKMPTDVYSSKLADSGSAQERYYSYMLMKEKLSNTVSDEDRNEILGSVSEKDNIKVQVLKKIIKLPESSPEFAQLCAITGTDDKFEQAEHLADLVYDRIAAKNVLKFYTPDESDFAKSFLENTGAALYDRLESVKKAGQAANLGYRAVQGREPATGVSALQFLMGNTPQGAKVSRSVR